MVTGVVVAAGGTGGVVVGIGAGGVGVVGAVLTLHISAARVRGPTNPVEEMLCALCHF